MSEVFASAVDGGGSGDAVVWPTRTEDYKKLEQVGKGGSAEVFLAKCLPNGKECAVKIVDLDKGEVSMDVLRKEIQALGMTDHEFVVKYHCSFVEDRFLWMVMDYMDAGSVLDIMKFKYPTGLEEPLIATVLRCTIFAIAYFHRTNRIHRDIKAGNLLLNSAGEIKLADLGVAAWMVEGGNHRSATQTFVGTPCWMAPEVMEQTRGHGYPADIWSFGITALELARGQAPFAKYAPLKVMVMVVNNPPPSLDEEEQKRFSKSFKEVVDSCLQKDPARRVTAEKLCGHKFFSKFKSKEYVAENMVKDLPLLGERFRLMKRREVESKARNLEKQQKKAAAHKEKAAALAADPAKNEGTGDGADDRPASAGDGDGDGAEGGRGTPVDQPDGKGKDGGVPGASAATQEPGSRADGDDSGEDDGDGDGSQEDDWDFGEAEPAAGGASAAGGDKEKRKPGKKARGTKASRAAAAAAATAADDGHVSDKAKKRSLKDEEPGAAAGTAAALVHGSLASSGSAVHRRKTTDGESGAGAGGGSENRGRFRVTDTAVVVPAGDEEEGAAPSSSSGGKRRTSQKAKAKAKTMTAEMYRQAKAEHQAELSASGATGSAGSAGDKTVHGRFLVSKKDDAATVANAANAAAASALADSKSTSPPKDAKGGAGGARRQHKCENCADMERQLDSLRAENDALRDKLRKTAIAAAAAAEAALASV